MAAPTLMRQGPDFKCPATGDQTIYLKSLRGKKVVIYFYPKRFPFELLSDPDEVVCKKFEVIKEKTLYGRKFMGIERSTFLIDERGKHREAWRKVKVKGHAAEVLEAVKNC